jgi:hypothetical protein
MTPQARICALTLVGLLVSPLFVGGQTIPTNGAPPGPRTSVIVGQVVDAMSDAPIPDAIVLINLPRYSPTLPTTPYGRVMADGEGRFFFSDLPAGDYYLQASQQGYVAGTYGQQKPMGQYQLLSLGQGEQRTDVKLHVWKYAVIAGTVLDEAGEPVVGVSVRALGRTVLGGRVQYGTTEIREDLVPTAVTDDRGMFRLSQLLPGTYVVAVPATQNTVPVESLTGQNSAARTELSYAGVSEVTALGQPRTLQSGDVALLTSSRMQVPPAASATGRMFVYPTTFYPAAMTAGDATSITVRSGDERPDVAITLRPVPAVRVSGRVNTPDGSAPPPMGIFLAGDASKDLVVRRPPPGNANFDTAVSLTDAAGRFTFLGVPPGEYVLEQSSPFLGRALQTGVPTYWVSQTITVGTSDITDTIVQARPAVHVAGRAEYRSAAGAEKPPIGSVGFDTPFGEPGQFFVQMIRTNGDLTFETFAAGGTYFIRPTENRGWFVQSVMVDGKDCKDRLFDLHEDTTSIVITFTDQPNRITGTVKDGRGVVSGSAVVLAFPADRQHWAGYGRSPRDLVSAITSASGVYTIPNLPPGDYAMIAVQADDADEWQDPTVLNVLSNRATKIKVNAGDQTRKLDLTVSGVR